MIIVFFLKILFDVDNFEVFVEFVTILLNFMFCFFGHIVCGVLEKAMAPHSSTLAWKIPWTEEPGSLQSVGSLRVGHD